MNEDTTSDAGERKATWQQQLMRVLVVLLAFPLGLIGTLAINRVLMPAGDTRNLDEGLALLDAGMYSAFIALILAIVLVSNTKPGRSGRLLIGEIILLIILFLLAVYA